MNDMIKNYINKRENNILNYALIIFKVMTNDNNLKKPISDVLNIYMKLNYLGHFNLNNTKDTIIEKTKLFNSLKQISKTYFERTKTIKNKDQMNKSIFFVSLLLFIAISIDDKTSYITNTSTTPLGDFIKQYEMTDTTVKIIEMSKQQLKEQIKENTTQEKQFFNEIKKIDFEITFNEVANLKKKIKFYEIDFEIKNKKLQKYKTEEIEYLIEKNKLQEKLDFIKFQLLLIAELKYMMKHDNFYFITDSNLILKKKNLKYLNIEEHMKKHLLFKINFNELDNKTTYINELRKKGYLFIIDSLDYEKIKNKDLYKNVDYILEKKSFYESNTKFVNYCDDYKVLMLIKKENEKITEEQLLELV